MEAVKVGLLFGREPEKDKVETFQVIQFCFRLSSVL